MVNIKVKEIRELKGLTLEQLEELSGVSKSHINAIELNKKNPTIYILYKLAKGLECKIEDLYEYK